ncbi:MAG: type II secretion system protein GspC [Motiliproteus sp.]
MNFQRYLMSALVLLLAYQAADLSWKLIAPSPAVSVPVVSVSQPGAVVAVDTRVDLLVSANLLGSVPTQAAPVVVVKAALQAVKSRHAVKLIGIVHSPTAARSVAILLSNNQQAAYVPGDTLNLGRVSRLLEVQQDRVVIEVDGQREYIELITERSKAGRISGVGRRTPTAGPLPRRIDLNGAGLKALVGDYRQKVLTDPLSFSRFVQISPQVENNRVIGYRLNAGRDGRLFKVLGLKPGDLVTHVNHIDLSKPENISALIALVSAGGSALVGIRRGNEQVDIDVEL